MNWIPFCQGWVHWKFPHIMGFIAQTCGGQEVGVYENTWLSSIHATIVAFVLARANGNGATNDYYAIESCILSHLCEGLKP
jgi:hypothetical protein